MSYDFSFPKRTIAIDNDSDDILGIISELLKKNNIPMTVVNEEEYNKKGILYNLIRQIETTTGEKLGGTKKVLPEIKVNLDSFAYSLLKEFQSYITNLLMQEKVSSKAIISEEISHKLVLIQEILSRLLCQALSLNTNNYKEGECLLKVTDEFIKELNAKKILFHKEFLGNTRTTRFGTSLACNIDYWKNLISNSIKVTKLLHKNTNACKNCFKSLETIKIIALRQLTVFMDSKKESEDYHDRTLENTFEGCLKVYNLAAIKEIFVSDYQISISNTNIILESTIEKHLKKSKLKQHANLAAIKNHFYFLSEIASLEKIISKIKVLMTALSWFPIITGILDLSKFAEYLTYISKKTDVILNTATLPLTESEKKILLTYTSMSSSNISLSAGFIKATDEIKDLNNNELIARLLKMVIHTTDELIELQNSLGITVIDERKLKSFYDSVIVEDTDTDETGKDKEKENSNLKGIDHSFPTHPGIFARKTKISDNKNALLSNTTKSDNSINEELISTVVKNENRIQHPCSIKFGSQDIISCNTYTLNQIENQWQIIFYPELEESQKIIPIPEIIGLNQILDKINFLELSEHQTMIESLILQYHLIQSLKDFINEAKYEYGLDYIKTYKPLMEQYAWLSKFAVICESTFHIEIAEQKLKTFAKIPHSENSLFLSKEGTRLNLQKEEVKLKLLTCLDVIIDSKIQELQEEENNCTIA